MQLDCLSVCVPCGWRPEDQPRGWAKGLAGEERRKEIELIGTAVRLRREVGSMRLCQRLSDLCRLSDENLVGHSFQDLPGVCGTAVLKPLQELRVVRRLPLLV